ncbi:hypothetical protein [Nostoc sp. LPT]|nr:hypothetical protein [Nostoc sp. LPT]
MLGFKTEVSDRHHYVRGAFGRQDRLYSESSAVEGLYNEFLRKS